MKGREVHYAPLMDFCHLKNSELEPQFQKYKSRVVLRGDFVKDDSDSYAVFTGTRIISIPNDSSKSHGYPLKIAWLRRTSSRRSIRLYSGQNGRCINVIKNSKVRVSRYLDTSTKAQVAKIMVHYGRPSRSS